MGTRTVDRTQTREDVSMPLVVRDGLEVRCLAAARLAFAVSGELDICTCPALDDLLEQAGHGDAQYIEFDFSEVSLMDSTAASLLWLHHRRMLAGGGRLVIWGARTQIRRVLHILDMDSLLAPL